MQVNLSDHAYPAVVSWPQLLAQPSDIIVSTSVANGCTFPGKLLGPSNFEGGVSQWSGVIDARPSFRIAALVGFASGQWVLSLGGNNSASFTPSHTIGSNTSTITTTTNNNNNVAHNTTPMASICNISVRRSPLPVFTLPHNFTLLPENDTTDSVTGSGIFLSVPKASPPHTYASVDVVVTSGECHGATLIWYADTFIAANQPMNIRPGHTPILGVRVDE